MRAAVLLAALLLGAPAGAAAQEVARPLEALREAAAAVAAEPRARARLAALGAAAAEQEAALADLRAELRALWSERAEARAALGERGAAAFAAAEALARIERLPAAALAAHPLGPVGAARAAGALSGVAPDIAAEARAAREALDRLREIEARRRAYAEAVAGAAAALAAARARIETAAAEGGAPDTALREAAASLDAAAARAGAPAPVDPDGFWRALGRLPAPARGAVETPFGAAGPDGAARGVTLSVAPWALVYAPWLSTVRYAGPAPGAGQVVVLEPAQGALILLAGLAQVSARAGDVVPAGAAVGAIGTAEDGGAAGAEILFDAAAPESTNSDASLYIETRRDGRAVDPAGWFAFTHERTTG